jgi:hypothetical protein
VEATRWVRALPWLGLAAGVFLVLYGTFLGTEGVAYRWMRRYGVVVYFGSTCIAMLVVSGAARRVALAPARVTRTLVALCVALPLIGLANAFAPLLAPDETSEAALQNIAEWWGGLIFTLFFLAIAWLWRATGFVVGFGTRRDG